MTLRLPHHLPRLALLCAVTFAVALIAFRALTGPGSGAPPVRQDDLAVPAPGQASTAGRIAALEALVRSNPDNAAALSMLGDAQLQRVRETGDAAFYTRAATAYERARRLAPRALEPLAGQAALALSRHDFRRGLALANEAHRRAPDVVRPLGLIVDAQVELGRYDDAARTLQAMVDAKPTLAAYARVSYFRELHGDVPGALDAMERAVSAGGDVPENLASVQTLLGNLEVNAGRLGAAERAYRTALVGVPGYVPASAGLAQVEAAHGDLGAAIARLRRGVAKLPLPQYVIQLGETQLAAGRRAGARDTFALVGAEQRLLQANGVNTDVDLALFEAGHGDTAQAVVLARRAWAEAPSVRSADALTWALTRDGRAAEALPWARRALRLGSRDPLFLFHAGMAARAAGEGSLARARLSRALAANPRFSPLYAPAAREALR